MDFDPAKDKHAGKQYVVINATKKPLEGVEVGGKQMKFGRDGWLRVKDPVLANDIRQKYGNTVTVTGIRAPDVHDRGHKFHFSVPELPWHKKEKADDAHPV